MGNLSYPAGTEISFRSNDPKHGVQSAKLPLDANVGGKKYTAGCRIYFDDKGGVKEVANPQRGKPVLTPTRTRGLVAAAQVIVALFPKQQAQDIEWLFVKDQLFIVQTRPYVTK